jgi:hypothetical protein
MLQNRNLRKTNGKRIKISRKKVGDYIGWYEAILNAIYELKIKSKKMLVVDVLFPLNLISKRYVHRAN